MRMPNFLIIGAAKAGTTSLYDYIKQHPEIYGSDVKEPHFFAFEGQVVTFRGPGDDRRLNRTAVTEIGAYAELFESVTNEKAIMEASAAYLYYPSVPKRIRSYLPEIRLLAILRNPVERAYSNFLHLSRDGREPLTDFMQALQKEEDRIRANWAPIWHYRALGFYSKQLRRYFECFDRSQIMVVLHDDLARDPMCLLQEVFRFLEVDESFRPDMAMKHNVSGIPRSGTLHRFLTKPSWLKTKIQPLLPAVLQRQVSLLLGELRNRNLERPELSHENYRYLLEIYERDILETAELIDRDLSPWLMRLN